MHSETNERIAGPPDAARAAQTRAAEARRRAATARHAAERAATEYARRAHSRAADLHTELALRHEDIAHAPRFGRANGERLT